MSKYGGYVSRELLNLEIQKKAKQINQRFYRLEKKNVGLKESAYYYAKHETGKSKPRYSVSLNKIAKMSDEEAEEVLLQLNKKIKSKTSTLRGLSEVEDKRLTKAIEALTEEGITDIDKELLNKFLTTEYKGEKGGNLLNRYYDSNQLIEDFLEKRKQGITTKQFIRIYKKHLSYKRKKFDLANVEKDFKKIIQSKNRKKL
jgi:hypothetical protein